MKGENDESHAITAIIGVHLGYLDARSAVLAKELDEVFQLYRAGKIKPIIGKTFALEEAVAANRYIHNRRTSGKWCCVWPSWGGCPQAGRGAASFKINFWENILFDECK